MKITKRQLKRIIREERRKLCEAPLPPMDPGEDLFVMVKDTILELFVGNGEVRTSDVYNRLRMNGLSDGEIDAGIEALGEAY